MNSLSKHTLRVLAALAILSAADLRAQAILEFAVEEGGGFSAVPSNATVNLQAPTVVTPATLRVRIRSLGTAAIQLNEISIANSRFTLSELPALPQEMTRGQAVFFEITYTPVGSIRVNAPLGVTVTSGTTITTFQLGLAGIAPEFRLGFTAGTDGNTLSLTDGTEVNFPATPIGFTSTAAFVIANVGSGSGALTDIRVEGANFTALGLPLFPSQVSAGQELRFGARFTPTTTGPQTGSLTIAAATGVVRAILIGNGAGSRFSFELIETTGSRSLEPGQGIQFADTGLGSTASLGLRVTNVGDASGVVPSIRLSGSSSLALIEVPLASAVIGPNGSFVLRIAFTPRADGSAAATLSVGTAEFPVSGKGVGLPSFRFTGVTSPVQEMQQPTVGLTLASAYPLAIRGVVNLGFESDTFAIDPALVFSTGSRSVTFQIPAGETEAIFSNGTRQIRFQTGTIAGTILLTPQFVAAEFDITPPGASTLRLTLPASLPRLTNLQIGSLSAGSVTFLVTGAATTRSVSTVEFVFNKIASSTAVFSETKVVVGLQNLSETYFRSPESSAFGGQFRAIVPFNFSATSGTAPDLLTVIESATVTLTNREGVSNTMTVPLR